MLNLIIGTILVLVGLIGIFSKWMLFWDVLMILLLIGIIAFGIIATLAGIKKIKKREA